MWRCGKGFRAFRVSVACLALPTMACSERAPDTGELGTASRPVRLIYQRSIGDGEQDSVTLLPRDIVTSGGKLYVLDEAEPDVRIGALDGQFILSIGRKGGGPAEFRSISGVAVDASGNLAVADPRSLRISVFSPSGSLAYDLRTRGPTGAIEYALNGWLHVDYKRPDTDNFTAGSPTIEVLDAKGQTVHRYGSYHPQAHPIADALNNETRFAAGPNGDMWVLLGYQGIVERRSTTGDLVTRVVLPEPRDRAPGGPFVRPIEGRADAIAVVRLPVADDIAVDTAGSSIRAVFVLAVQGGTRGVGRYSDLLVYDESGYLLETAPLSREAARITVEDGMLYALRRNRAAIQAIDIYEIQYHEMQ